MYQGILSSSIIVETYEAQTLLRLGVSRRVRH